MAATNPSADQPDPSPQGWEEPGPSDPPPVDPQVLRDVLKATLSAAAEGEPVAAEELAALLAVAKRYPDHAFDIDPVATSLVEAMLQLRQPQLTRDEHSFRAMSRAIAGELCEAPLSRARMEHLWQQLRESAS